MAQQIRIELGNKASERRAINILYASYVIVALHFINPSLNFFAMFAYFVGYCFGYVNTELRIYRDRMIVKQTVEGCAQVFTQTLNIMRLQREAEEREAVEEFVRRMRR